MLGLKPCPFCGGKAILDRHDIFCDSCEVKMQIPLYVTGNKSVGDFPTYEEARQEMIDNWNRRAENA